MHPVHDVDAILLLSLSVAAKRRPADLIEIATAIALAQGAIPAAPLMSESFARLSVCGLVIFMDGGLALSADAQAMMVSLRRNDGIEKKRSRILELLAKYPCKDEHDCIQVEEAQLVAAVKASREASASPVRSLLVKPKSKPVWISKKDLVQGRKHLPPAKRRKS